MNILFPMLTSPYRVNGHYYKNRVLTSPVNQPFLTLNGCLSPEGAAHLVEQAKGGFAQVTIGEQPVDPDHSMGKGFDIFSDPMRKDVVQSIASCVENIHNNGALCSIELGHAGAGMRFPAGCNTPIYGPNEETTPDGAKILAMDEARMDLVINQFCTCAVKYKSLGFDGIVLHCGHGCLLAQFISARTNHRTDGYGGSLENRIKFPVKLIKAVRNAVGKDFIIELRISGEECAPSGITIQDNIIFLKELEGTIDLVHVSAGVYDIPPLFVRVHPSIYHPNGCNMNISAAIKERINIPVVVVGAINTPELAEDILASGKSDFIAMGRQTIADPMFAKKILTGKQDTISNCIRCLNCMDIGAASNQLLKCSVNPRAGRLTCFPVQYPKTPEPKKVFVIGGGPAGMTAALTASRCGHKVTIFEKTDRFGGALKFSDFDQYKSDLRRFKNSLMTQVMNSDISIKVNFEVTPEYLAERNPDVIIVSVGSTPIIPKIKGIDRDNVFHATYAYTKISMLKKDVVLIGGGLVGCEAAIYLKSVGFNVSIIESMDGVARDCTSPHKIALMEQLKGINILTNCKVTEIFDDGVEYEDISGESHKIECGTILYATGMRPQHEVTDAFSSAKAPVIPIGDCLKSGKVLDAVHSGYFAAINI